MSLVLGCCFGVFVGLTALGGGVNFWVSLALTCFVSGVSTYLLCGVDELR